MARTSVMISQETKKRLRIVEGKMMSKNGKGRSYDNVINELISFFEERTQE